MYLSSLCIRFYSFRCDCASYSLPGGEGLITRVNFNQYSNSLSTKNYYHELSNSLLVCVFILEILFSELMGGVNKGEPLWLTL